MYFYIEEFIFYMKFVIELIRYSYEKYTRNSYLKYKDRPIVGKVAIVTGSNTGIGKECVLELVKRNATVVLACRNKQLGEKAIEDIRKKTLHGKMELMLLDLSDLSSVYNFCLNFKNKYSRLDILINNAGVYDTSGIYKTTKDGFELHFGTNYLGHFVLTQELLDVMKNSPDARIISVSSSTQVFTYPYYAINDLNLKQPKSWGLFNSLGYGISKYYNSLHAKELQKRVKSYGINCYSVCPGYVDTDIFRYMDWYKKLASQIAVILFGIPPEQGCQTIIYLALCEDGKAEPGKFYRFHRLHETINAHLKEERCEELWEATEEILWKHKLKKDTNYNEI